MTQPYEKLHLYITLLAALAMTVACIVSGMPVYMLALWVSVTIVLFYVIGSFVRFFFITKIFPPAAAETTEEIMETDAETLIPSIDDVNTEPLENAFMDS
jgi:uncharacterized membrane protein YqjE